MRTVGRASSTATPARSTPGSPTRAARLGCRGSAWCRRVRPTRPIPHVLNPTALEHLRDRHDREHIGVILIDGAIVDEDLHQLDREHLADICARGLRFVVLSRSPDASIWEGLAGPTLPIDAEPGEIVMSLRRALRGDIGQRHRRGAGIGSPTTPSGPALVRARSLRPRTIAFWGGAGSPGRITLALSTLALSGAVRPTVLLELDTTGASLVAYLDDGDDWRPRRARCSVLELVNGVHARLRTGTVNSPESRSRWARSVQRPS
jgi:hypothetical protein